MVQRAVGIHVELPFESRISPLRDRVEEAVEEWARRVHLVQSDEAREHFAGCRFGELAARCYPDAELDRLTLVGEWVSWEFRVDDQFDDGPLGRHPHHVEDVADEMLAIVSASAAGGPEPRSPVADALRDLWSRTVALTSRAWQRRFVKHLDRWFETFRGESANRAQRSHPQEAAHQMMRRYGGGTQNMQDLIEVAGDYELPPAFEAGAAFRQARDLTADVIHWTNDLVSLRKEMARDDIHNSIVLAQHHRGVSIDEAAAHLERELRRRVDDFAAAEARVEELMGAAGLSADERAAVRRSLEGMRLMMRGYLDWTLHTARYSNVEPTPTGEVPSHLDVILHIPHLPHHPRPQFGHLGGIGR